MLKIMGSILVFAAAAGMAGTYKRELADHLALLYALRKLLVDLSCYGNGTRQPGLDEKKKYRVETTGEVYCGDTLVHAGLNVPAMWGDFQSVLIHLSEVSDEQ